MKRVLGRHQHLQPSLESYALTILPAADAFIETYDRLRTLTATRGQELIDDLTPAIETAKTEWAEADGLKSEHQTLVTEKRKNSKLFETLLVAFRKSLARALARNHPDYQTLRATKIDRNVLEEGEEADLPPDLIPQDNAAAE